MKKTNTILLYITSSNIIANKLLIDIACYLII